MNDGISHEQIAKNQPLKLNLKNTCLIGLAFMSISMFWQVYDAYMPLFLLHFDLSQTVKGFIMALESIMALFLLPLFGHFSDNFPFRQKTGRRVPFVVLGSIVAAVMLILVNLAHNNRNLAFMISMIVIMLVFMNLYRSPAVSLMPDITPKKIRSNANTVINIMGALGMVLALGLSMLFKDTQPSGKYNDYGQEIIELNPSSANWVIFGVTAAVMILVALIFVFFIKENKLVKQKNDKLLELSIIEEEKAKKLKTLDVIKGLSRSEKKSLLFLLLSVFLWYMAYNAITTWFSTYSHVVLSQKDFELPLIIGNVAAFSMFVPAAILGKKIGRKKTVLCGVGILASAFAAGTLIQFLTSNGAVIKYAMFPVFVLVGAGWATINVHSFVMSVEFSTEKTNGIFTGIYYTFVMAANAITPIISGAIFDGIDGLGSTGLNFLLPYCLCFSVLAFLSMFLVKHGNVKEAAKING